VTSNNPLSQDVIADLLKKEQEQKARKSSGSGGPRKKKDPTEPRDYPTWWKLQQYYGTCDNPDCEDVRVGGGPEGHAMVAEIKERKVCRYCFLNGWLSDASDT